MSSNKLVTFYGVRENGKISTLPKNDSIFYLGCRFDDPEMSNLGDVVNPQYGLSIWKQGPYCSAFLDPWSAWDAIGALPIFGGRKVPVFGTERLLSWLKLLLKSKWQCEEMQRRSSIKFHDLRCCRSFFKPLPRSPKVSGLWSAPWGQISPAQETLNLDQPASESYAMTLLVC